MDEDLITTTVTVPAEMMRRLIAFQTEHQIALFDHAVVVLLGMGLASSTED